MLECDAGELALRTQADLLSLSRSGLYYQPVLPGPEELWIKRRIDEIYTAHPFYGSRKITAVLGAEMLINRKAVQRHMREMGLSAICPGPNLSRRAQAQRTYCQSSAKEGRAPSAKLGQRLAPAWRVLGLSKAVGCRW